MDTHVCSQVRRRLRRRRNGDARVEALDPLKGERRRRRSAERGRQGRGAVRGGAEVSLFLFRPPPRNVRAPAAASPRPASTEYPCRYRGREKYYPGKISRDRGDGTFDIAYDDGERETRVEERLIRKVGGSRSRSPSPSRGRRLREGARVEARYRGRSKFYPGKISRDRGDGTFDIASPSPRRNLPSRRGPTLSPPPRNIHVVAVAAPRTASARYIHAIHLAGTMTASPRRACART